MSVLTLKQHQHSGVTATGSGENDRLQHPSVSLLIPLVS